MRLLLDQDGPLADFEQYFWDRSIEVGYQFDIDGPQFSQRRFMTDHIPNLEHRAAARKMVNSDPFWFHNLPPVAGAIEGTRKLIASGIDVWVVTKPLEANPGCRDGKGAWLREWLPELEDKLIITPDKSLVVGDVLLDDAPSLTWLRRAEWQPVIFKAPWNGERSEWAGLYRWSWDEPMEKLLRWMRDAHALRTKHHHCDMDCRL